MEELLLYLAPPFFLESLTASLPACLDSLDSTRVIDILCQASAGGNKKKGEEEEEEEEGESAQPINTRATTRSLLSLFSLLTNTLSANIGNNNKST